ncbi:MAG: glycosyltransferase [Lentisphaerae bacterium]|nr:glycosyltransferase [Lentisphaerota bacterium]
MADPAAQSRVSVVIPMYNAEATIGACLDALRQQTRPNLEIVVVDDGSTDRSVAIASGYAVRLLRRNHEGASAARDRGFRESTGACVAYTDADTIPSPDWIETLMRNFEDERVGAVTGRTVFRADARLASHVRRVDIARRYRRRRRETTLANGPNCVFRRRVLEEVGGFDPRWYHAEDTQVSYRTREAGYRILYDPGAVVEHVPEGDWRTFIRKRYRDARAYIRVIPAHGASVRRDDFVTAKMKVQPPLFALAAGGLLLSMPAVLLGWGSRIAAGAGVLLLTAWGMDVPFALEVARESGRRSFFFKTMALQLLAGLAWALGLVVGGCLVLRPGPRPAAPPPRAAARPPEHAV